MEVLRDKEWQTLPLDRIRIGDVLRAKQGEKIAADGEVMEGACWCDESHLTGEPEAIEKQVKAKLFAGAIVGNGSVIYRAEAVGSATMLGDMVKALDEAQNSKAPVARLADKVAAVFVPAVVAIAVLTFWAIISFQAA